MQHGLVAQIKCSCRILRYSFEAGPVHFAMVNTELALGSGAQLGWLDADLGAVDRGRTPWVVVMGHRPMQSGLGDSAALNQLFDRHAVDLTVAGHVHFARQSCALRGGKCVLAPNVTGGYDGVVHVIAGNGGQALNNATARSVEFPYTGSGCVRQLRHHFGPFLAHFSAPPHTHRV